MPNYSWNQVKKLASAKGIEVLQGKGGERKLKGKGPDGKIQILRIGHTSCAHAKSDVKKGYIAKLKLKFGWTDDDLKNA